MKAINIIEKIVDNGEYINEYNDYLKRLDKNEKKEFWINSFSIDNIFLKEDLFLNLPGIWEDFDKNDWIDVLKNNSPRPNISEKEDSKIWDNNGFKDLIILNKYLKINPFDLIYENKEEFTLIDVVNCFRYGIIMNSLFYEPEDYLQEAFEDSKLKYSDLMRFSKKLISQNCKERLPDESSLKEWLIEKMILI